MENFKDIEPKALISHIAIPEPGQIVRVRTRMFVVGEVQKSTLPLNPLYADRASPQHLIKLTSIDDDTLGEELEVIWELEPGVRALDRVELPEPTGFDSPSRLDAFLNAIRWGAVASAEFQALQSPFRSGIEMKDESYTHPQ